MGSEERILNKGGDAFSRHVYGRRLGKNQKLLDDCKKFVGEIARSNRLYSSRFEGFLFRRKPSS